MKLLLILLGLLAFCSAQTVVIADVLELHNNERAVYNIPALKWSDDLESSAQAWANKLAADGDFHHSGESGVGENLAEGTSEKYSTGYTTSDLIQFWIDEKENFIPGCTFPDCGDDVGHYTQMIWNETKTIGCGKATDGSVDILVCQYAPPGNYIGEKPY